MPQMCSICESSAWATSRQIWTVGHDWDQPLPDFHDLRCLCELRVATSSVQWMAEICVWLERSHLVEEAKWLTNGQKKVCCACKNQQDKPVSLGQKI